MRARIAVALVLVAAAMASVVGVAGAGAAAAPAVAAARDTRPEQVVTVRAARRRATVAVLEVWARTATGYRRIAGPWSARVGRRGIGHAVEGSGRTPAGVFPLGTGFGVGTRDPGAQLGWFTVDDRDWWGSDVLSPSTYNRHVRCRRSACAFRPKHAEHLADYARAYRYAMFIGYNAPPDVRVGAGSAFFVHVGTGRPTAGCVSLPASKVVWLLRRMHRGAVVSIGVGAAAYAPLHG
ncbi:MAG TPA: L,D-transpeptidase family protein [Kineosporiaceae bacterium]|jgi:L,D-peptidoglycan transpeptidase YkuD (ErfK/YbiS/YcfS/YnhG family)|nr:L,D-transpeptidase family protein [Kineosporiaceae bacterium]